MIKDIERDPTFEIDRNYQTYLKVKKYMKKKKYKSIYKPENDGMILWKNTEH